MKYASFLMKLAVVFFLLALAFGIAGWGAWKYWHAMFSALGYNATDFIRLDMEHRAMKTPLNLTMYAMPVGSWCASAGFLAASCISFLLDGAGEVTAYFADRFSVTRNKGGNHA